MFASIYIGVDKLGFHACSLLCGRDSGCNVSSSCLRLNLFLNYSFCSDGLILLTPAKATVGLICTDHALICWNVPSWLLGKVECSDVLSMLLCSCILGKSSLASHHQFTLS